MKVGQKVKVIENTTRHAFEIGSIVEFIEDDNPLNGMLFEGLDVFGIINTWWMTPNEYKIINDGEP